MGKYTALQLDVFSVFASQAWQDGMILTVPDNVVQGADGKDYIRVSVLASGKGANRASTSGLVLIDIFTSAGNGPSAAAAIADKLDDFLANKQLATSSSGVTQFGSSSFAPEGADPANATLFRSTFTIPFNYFGVL
jgi:hypothetical protein